VKKTILIAIIGLFLVTPQLGSQEIKPSSKVVVKKSVTDIVFPNVTVSGNEQPIDASNGIAVLTAAIDAQSVPANLAKIKYKWVVMDNGVPRKDVIIWPDGTKVIIGAGTQPRIITVILYVGCLYGTKDGDVVNAADINFPDPIFVNVTVGVPPVIPPTPVNPNPPAPSALPDGKYKIAQTAYGLVLTDVPLAARSASPALSASFSSIATQVAAGTLTGSANILAALRSSNAAALVKTGVNAADWAQWNKLFGDAVYTFYSNKTLNTNDDWNNLLTETALGLSAVK
jgi:hypothetical protein